MLIDKEDRLMRLTFRLKKNFADRLLFVGLQGSYRRGEATEESDFDVMVVLDKLSADDLALYREILMSLPHYDKACGFISGKEELLHWPKHELFQLQQETQSYWGSLDELLPPIDEKDIIDSVKIGAANLYHGVSHLCLFGNQETKMRELRDAYKFAFFVLQLLYYLTTGEYIHTRNDLLKKLDGRDREILSISLNWHSFESHREKQPEYFFETMIKWCSEVLIHRTSQENENEQ